MAMSPDFKNAVDTKDVRLVRIMLKDSMVLDPTFREFDSLLTYAEARLHDLYDAHDGEAFSSDSAAWDKDLLNEQMVNVVYNFSKERIAFLKKLCRKIYAQRGAAEPVRPHTAYPRAEHQQTGAKKHVGTGLIVGGAAVAIVGAVTSYPVAVAAGAVVAVAGGVVYYQNR